MGSTLVPQCQLKGHYMARDFDEVRPDVAEASGQTHKDVRNMDAPTARNVHADLEEADLSEGIELPCAIVLDGNGPPSPIRTNPRWSAGT